MPNRSLTPEILDRIARRFRILAEPARLQLLTALMDGEQTVTSLIDETGLSQANVSKHLQLLREGRFVERRKEGLFAYYRIVDPSVERLCDIMCARLEAQAEAERALLATGT